MRDNLLELLSGRQRQYEKHVPRLLDVRLRETERYAEETNIVRTGH